MAANFDKVEIQAARTMGEADWYWKRHLKKIPAARHDIAPMGFIPKIRRVLDAVLLRDGLR